MTRPMRFGLVGTGPWAATIHGPGLASADGIELVGAWGRSPEKSAPLAATLGVEAFTDFDQLLDEVEAVTFAVPPDAQVELAGRAARAGKHLLLEKPVATSGAAARALADEAAAHDVASLVFFTDRFSEHGSRWLAEVAGAGPWRGGGVQALAALDTPGNPFGASAWRRERGALWDVGPHALSTLIGALGPVESVVAVGGAQDLVHLVLEHADGATSTATMTLLAPPAAEGRDVWVWGEAGVRHMPTEGGDAVAALSAAAVALRDSARTGEPHPADLRLGVRVVELLEEAERQLHGGR